ncbi:MAG: hypothetical protein OEY37_12150, partial [Gammaproteobacteria bacterium]|nr:hypothetical protein [Gammaproteobacteria bacterium]
MANRLLDNLDRRLAAGEQPLPAFKQTLRQAHLQFAQRFEHGTRAGLLVRAAAHFTDAVLQRAWSQF